MRVAGLGVWSATSLFGGVTACSSIAQTGCRSGMGLLDDAGVRARGDTSRFGRVTAGSGNAQCFDTVT